MRVAMLLGFALLACGGASQTEQGDGPIQIANAGRAGAVASFGPKPSSVAGSSAGTSAGGGQASGGSSQTAGAPTAGAGAGDGGAPAGNGGSGEQGGAPPAPDDTGCVERPWTGNQADLSERLAGLDCSSCTTGSALGYTVPTFCAGSLTCSEVVDLATLPDDFLLLLPPGSAQQGICGPQNCESADGAPADLEGFTLQLALKPLEGAFPSIKIETDDNRRVLKREVPLLKCSEVASCYAFGAGAQFLVVVKPDAPRGWVHITTHNNETCE